MRPRHCRVFPFVVACPCSSRVFRVPVKSKSEFVSCCRIRWVVSIIRCWSHQPSRHIQDGYTMGCSPEFPNPIQLSWYTVTIEHPIGGEGVKLSPFYGHRVDDIEHRRFGDFRKLRWFRYRGEDCVETARQNSPFLGSELLLGGRFIDGGWSVGKRPVDFRSGSGRPEGFP